MIELNDVVDPAPPQWPASQCNDAEQVRQCDVGVAERFHRCSPGPMRCKYGAVAMELSATRFLRQRY
ncbi:hypothetical protein DEO72_LG10g943 [Vigna unguiculata]|uniref:Uncharacterized protein n=1 Tax=Vigna unguiculata TaxID=3917 RepID=A0A4D6NA33_VIGUN|nr:hypothetical protein DEO72_LG10g943 [Vigna unguiculata]